MKHFSYYFFHTCLFFVFIICSMSLTACRTMRTSEKAVSESETASVTASRLTFYRTIDSLSRQFNMAADSIIMIFPNTSMTEFPTAFPSRIEGCAETPSDTSKFSNLSKESESSRSVPKQVKVYGLHVTGVSDKKSVVNADLKDSVTVATQSKMDKSASKQSSDPSKVPKWICLCMVMVILLYILYKIR